MTLAFVQDGSIVEYPVTPTWVRKKFPNTSFPKNLEAGDFSDIGVVTVGVADTPAFDPKTQKVEDTLPELVDGVWIQGWSVVDKTAEEIQAEFDGAASAVRSERNERLADCDWTQLVDSPLDAAVKTAWANYREELRLVPQQAGFPWDVQWPSQPV